MGADGVIMLLIGIIFCGVVYLIFRKFFNKAATDAVETGKELVEDGKELVEDVKDKIDETLNK